MSIGAFAARRRGQTMHLSWAITAALCGCGIATPREVGPASLPEAEYFAGGARLVPRVADAAGDVGYLVGWYDTLLETPCDFYTASDGVSRCLPLQLGSVTRGDAQCAQRFALLPAGSCSYGAEAFERVSWYLDASSSCHRRIYRRAVAAEVVQEARPGYRLSFEGICSPDVESTVEVGSFPVTLVDPAEFVAAHLQPSDDERAPGMKAWLRMADDGAWEIRGFFDVERDTPCSIGSVSTDELDRCLPAPRRAFDQTFKAGQSCARDAVLASECDEEPVRAFTYGSRSDEADCSPRGLSLVHAEGPVQVGLCARDALEPERAPPSSVYVVGDWFTDDRWPRLERLYVGRGRLKLRFLGSGGVPFLPDLPDPTQLGRLGFGSPPRRDALGFWDSQLNEPCSAVWIDDNHAVCVSASWLAADDPMFAQHATCLSDPLTEVARRGRCGDALPDSVRGLFVPLPASRSCWLDPPPASAYQLHTAELFTGDPTYRDGRSFLVDPLFCQETQREPGFDYFLPGERLASDLVAGIEVHEPGR